MSARDDEAIRADARAVLSIPHDGTASHQAAHRLAADVPALLASRAELAEAKAENESMRASIERLREQQRRRAGKHDRLEFARRDATAERDEARAELVAARLQLARVRELCTQNDGGLNQAHLVQLVEYIAVAAGSDQ